MDRSRFYKEKIPLPDRNILQISGQLSFFDCFPDFFLCAVSSESVHKSGILCRIQHIPHFRLAQLSMLMFLCICICRMHLHRQIFPGVNKFDQQRQFRTPHMTGSQICRISGKHLPQRLSGKFTLCHKAWSVRMSGTLPRFCQRRHFYSFFKFRIQSLTAPQIIFAGRS